MLVAQEYNIPNELNPLRNTSQKYLKFINSEVFSEEARKFLRYGYYTDAPYGTKDYNDYWDEQEKRVIEGYSVGGVRVTGRHYFYLNFCQIKARPININTGQEDENSKKIITFPRFLDHNFYWFNEFEECCAEGLHLGKKMEGMIVAKSRRKGFTYQVTGGVFNYNYNFVPSSTNILAAYEKGHYKVTLDGIHFSINHINKATDWGKRRDVLNKRDHFRASFKYTNEAGIEVEDGYMSEVVAISFKDNPFKSIGESASLMAFEEAGKFSGLLDAYTISEPTFRDGDIMTGVPLIYGTGGDMEGGTEDFATMFYDPKSYGLKSYQNIYDENVVGDCGWFIDDMWYYPGSVVKKHFIKGFETDVTIPFVDEHGNSNRQYAEESLDEKRKLRAKGSRDAYNKFITQQPKSPSEAFLRIQGNVFDSARAQARLGDIMSNKKKYIDSIFKASLEIVPGAGIVQFKNCFDSVPIYDFPLKDNKNKPGAIEIYEHPLISGGEDGARYGRYIAGIDSYDKDVSSTNSVGSLLLLDTWTDRLVCHYKGRPMSNVFYENCRRILKYYNATACYERSNINIYTYFHNQNSVHLLADEPNILKEKGLATRESYGNNKKGVTPSEKINALGIELSLIWLDSVADGTDPQLEIKNYDILRSIPLLKELIHWNDKGNYDDISALGMLMIYREDKKKTISKLVEKVKTRADDPYWRKFDSKSYYR